jgi:membrane-bound hydrogenase subunit beta
MTQEEIIAQELIKKFSFLEGHITTPRRRRVFVEVELKDFLEVFEYSKKHLRFTHLCTITGLDELDKLSFIYHLTQEAGMLLNIKTSVSKDNPEIKSVIPLFPSAEIYERELVDLFGAKVQGLPEGSRYPLTDDWPKGEFPLRKDWKLKTEEEKRVD